MSIKNTESKTILRYQSGIRDECVCLGSKHVSISGFTNSDSASCSTYRKSTSLSFSLWEVPYLGDLASKNVFSCLLHFLFCYGLKTNKMSMAKDCMQKKHFHIIHCV